MRSGPGRAAKLGAQRVGGGDRVAADLVDRLGTDLDGGGARGVKQAHGLGGTAMGLGSDGRAAGGDGLGGGVGVDRVGLALSVADTPVGTVDVEDRQARRVEDSGELGAVGAGASTPTARTVPWACSQSTRAR